MDYLSLVRQRKSIREFKDRDVADSQMKEIKNYFQGECGRLLPQIGVEALIFDGGAKEKLEGIAGYTGFVTGAPYYLALVTQEMDGAAENAGYICEDMILKMTEMGLDCCWNTFADREAVKRALEITSDGNVAAVLAFGYGKKEKEQTLLDIKSPSEVGISKKESHIAPKLTVDELVYYEEWGKRVDLDENVADDGLCQAFYAASLAPSYLNRQPYRLILDFGKAVLVGFEDELTDDYSQGLNCGAVMLNFSRVLWESRTLEPQWKLGSPEKEYKLPKGHKIIGFIAV